MNFKINSIVFCNEKKTFLKRFLEDISPFRGTSGIPVLNLGTGFEPMSVSAAHSKRGKQQIRWMIKYEQTQL